MDMVTDQATDLPALLEHSHSHNRVTRKSTDITTDQEIRTMDRVDNIRRTTTDTVATVRDSEYV